MSGFSIRKHGDTALLKGFMNGSVPLATILEGPSIEVVHFGEVTGINSLGAASMFEFTTKWGDRRFTYAECPQCIVDAVVMLPALLGPEEKPARITSLFVPYRCVKCDQGYPVLILANDIKIGPREQMTFPTRACPGCKGTLETEPVADDYRVLLERGALTLKKSA